MSSLIIMRSDLDIFRTAIVSKIAGGALNDNGELKIKLRQTHNLLNYRLNKFIAL